MPDIVDQILNAQWALRQINIALEIAEKKGSRQEIFALQQKAQDMRQKIIRLSKERRKE